MINRLIIWKGGKDMKTKKAAEAIIILGSLTIASFVCPSPCPHIIFGALVVVFGVVLIRKL